MLRSVPAAGARAIGVFTYPARGTCARIVAVTATTSPAPLVGRAAERAAIAAALRALRGRPGCVVAIEGEPGIGKSRLLGELTASAAAGGCTVLEASASEFEADLPYALFTEALDGHLAARRSPARATRRGGCGRARGRAAGAGRSPACRGAGGPPPDAPGAARPARAARGPAPAGAVPRRRPLGRPGRRRGARGARPAAAHGRGARGRGGARAADARAARGRARRRAA